MKRKPKLLVDQYIELFSDLDVENARSFALNKYKMHVRGDGQTSAKAWLEGLLQVMVMKGYLRPIEELKRELDEQT